MAPTCPCVQKLTSQFGVSKCDSSKQESEWCLSQKEREREIIKSIRFHDCMKVMSSMCSLKCYYLNTIWCTFHLLGYFSFPSALYLILLHIEINSSFLPRYLYDKCNHYLFFGGLLHRLQISLHIFKLLLFYKQQKKVSL